MAFLSSIVRSALVLLAVQLASFEANGAEQAMEAGSAYFVTFAVKKLYDDAWQHSCFYE